MFIQALGKAVDFTQALQGVAARSSRRDIYRRRDCAYGHLACKHFKEELFQAYAN
jgi:hypothetical protein